MDIGVIQMHHIIILYFHIIVSQYFEYLGARIEANGKSTPEIRRRLAMATTKLTKMISIWKGQCKKTKLRVLETVVFPTALYGCEAWTINNTDAKRITSFEMKCYRKILENILDGKSN